MSKKRKSLTIFHRPPPPPKMKLEKYWKLYLKIYPVTKWQLLGIVQYFVQIYKYKIQLTNPPTPESEHSWPKKKNQCLPGVWTGVLIPPPPFAMNFLFFNRHWSLWPFRNELLVKCRCELIGHTLFWNHWLLRYGQTGPQDLLRALLASPRA